MFNLLQSYDNDQLLEYFYMQIDIQKIHFSLNFIFFFSILFMVANFSVLLAVL